MPRSNLEVLGKPEHKYGNSSPRHMRENHYANSCARFENFLGFQNYKISITLLIYFKKNMRLDRFLPIQTRIYEKISI